MTTKEMMDIALKLAGLDELHPDTSISVEGSNIKRVLAGIDMGAAELLTAKEMGYDCVARHHNIVPVSSQMGDWVYHDHFEKLVNCGVPINVAQKVVEERKRTERHALHAMNMDSAASMARLLNMPFIGIHTPADLLAERAIERQIDPLLDSNPRATLQDIIDELKNIREFAESPQDPEIWVGKPDSYAGKIVVSMAGVLAMDIEEYKALIQAGYGTFLVMHMKPDVEKELQKDKRCNVIVTGHMASDSLGFNQILDAWEAEGLKIDRVGGLV